LNLDCGGEIARKLAPCVNPGGCAAAAAAAAAEGEIASQKKKNNSGLTENTGWRLNAQFNLFL
jgi:hypothetical protein